MNAPATARIKLPDLPVAEARPALCSALARRGCAVLSAPTGSGKTTLLPLMLLDEPWLAGQRILMLEPRRVAARMAAARMASLLGEPVGERVGYQIRFERKVSARTRIEVVTEGLLTRRLQADADLPGVGLVIFDEFHERSLDADLALALTLDARAALRPELRVLVMSATLDTPRLAALIGGKAGPAPIVQSAGRLYPVDIRYAGAPAGKPIGEQVAMAAMQTLDETSGDILAFLPGTAEIRSAQRAIEARLGASIAVFPLHGQLSSREQDLALGPAPQGLRKIILATNVAQTSLTVEGVTAVVDSGWARVAQFDLGAGATRLETRRISRASADQRAGRAGRLGPGLALRLWSRDAQAQLPAFDAPEIAAADLSRFALELAAWGVTDPAGLALLDQPQPPAWRYAGELLAAIGALDGSGRLTAHGRELARLPASPRFAHLLSIAKARGIGDLGCWLAAALDERLDDSDLAAAVSRFMAGRGEPVAQRRIEESRRQFARLLGIDTSPAGRREASSSDTERLIGTLTAAAFPERIGRRRELERDAKEAAWLCADGGEARLPRHDPLATSEWLAIAHWEPGPPRKIRLAATLASADVLRDEAAHILSVDDIRWDAQSEAVVAERQRRLGAIVLDRQPLREGQQQAIADAMLDGLRRLGLAALPWTEPARQLQARLANLREWRPQEPWPDLADEQLLATLDDWLRPYLAGISRREHLNRLDLVDILEAPLDWPQRQALATLVPTHLDVPSGSRVALEYTAGQPPVLAVKLQELFGLASTPTVNEGRTPVMLHLLSPARRPIQVTRDLASFWERTYPEVKKELKGRYPRHPWPDDPLTAPPTARTRRAAG